MAVYRRGKIWWYRFEFCGRRIQESSHCTNKHRAEVIEAKRKTDLVEGRAGINRKAPSPRFEDAVQRFWIGRSTNTDPRHTTCSNSIAKH